MAKPRPSYFKRHHPRHVGVVQRCRVGVCNPDTRCRVHSWSWSVELPSRSGRRQRHGKGGYLTAREAADARAEAIHRHKIGKLPDVDAARVTLEQWLPRWIDEREQAGELRDTTAATYRQLIEHKPDGLLAGQPTILTKLGHMRLVDLRGTHLTQAYQALMADRAAARAKAEQANQRRKVRFGVPPPLGPVTIARLHAVVSGALKTAMKEDIMPTNPAANAKLPKRERTKCIPWPPEVLGAFLDAVADHRLYPVFVLAAFTGLRRGEIAGLQWADIDLDGAKLTVARQRVVLTGQNEAGR
jgi:hypothetical protein